MHLARNGVNAPEGDQRRILIVGTRTLYLQALCELLDGTTGLCASLLAPGQLRDSSMDPSPEVVLLDCLAGSDGLEPLVGEIGELHKGAPIVLLTWGSARDSSKQAASLHAEGWVSMSLPIAELVKVISDRTGRASDAGTTSSRGARRPGGAVEWPLSALSEREMSVLRLVVDGSSPDEIATTLGISRHTVRTHLQNVMAKMLVRSRTEMVSVARKSGMRPTPGLPQS
jgi:DNA-binding NarL/FixJ family response regulator